MNRSKYHVRTQQGLIYPLLRQGWVKANKSQQHSTTWKSTFYLDGSHSRWLLQNKTQDPLVLMRYPLTMAFTKGSERMQSKNIHECWLSQYMQSAENHMGSSASLAAANKTSQARRAHRFGFLPQPCQLVRKLLPSKSSGFCPGNGFLWGIFKISGSFKQRLEKQPSAIQSFVMEVFSFLGLFVFPCHFHR